MSGVGDILGKAREHELAGRWIDAVELLTRSNRDNPDKALARELLFLRRRAWDAAVTGSRQSPGGASSMMVDPPARGGSGLPEVVGKLPGSGVLQAALQSGGCLLLRGAIHRDSTRRLTGLIDEAIREQGSSAGKLEPNGSELLRRSANAGVSDNRIARTRRFVEESGGALLMDSPEALFELLLLYEELGLRNMAEEFLGSRVVISANKSTLRKVQPDVFGGWHQDGAFLGEGVRALNLWLPLSPCGVDAPGLEIVPRRLDCIAETGTGDAWFDWTVGQETVTALAGDSGTVVPTFEAGDLLLFDQMLLHRTSVSSGMRRARYAIEFWCFSIEGFPGHHVPLVW